MIVSGRLSKGDSLGREPELVERFGHAGAAEEHWRAHMTVVGRIMLGQQAAMVVELLHH